MMRVRVRPEDVMLELRRLPRRLYETEELLVILRRRLPTLTYHQLYRYLSMLVEAGLVRRTRIRVIYYDPKTGRRYTVTRVMWEVRPR